MTEPRYVLVANPGSPRCEHYHRELLAFWNARGVAVRVDLVPWADVIARDGNLLNWEPFRTPAIVRLESPGKDDNVTKLLLDAGCRAKPEESFPVGRDIDLPKGLLLRPGLMFEGFRRVLHGLKHSFTQQPHLTPTACPLAIEHMFDKFRSGETLRIAGIPVPKTQRLSIFEHAARTDYANFIKLNTGSSAVGIVFLDCFYNHNWKGISSVVEVDGQFYNTRQLQHIQGEAHFRVVNFLQTEGAIHQRAIPNTELRGQNFDVRVVCHYGRPVATIFRVSPHPMTNLHLGGRRGEWAECRAIIPTRNWLDGLDLASAAAGCFDSAIAGVDLLFRRGDHAPYILEVNAFGDFFPGWTNSDGQSLHQLEIAATAQKYGFL